MGLCKLCGPLMYHEAEFAISYGLEDRLLLVCRWCHRDLTLLGFNANQVVHLETSKRVRRIPLSLVVLGPFYTLLEAKA